MHSVLLTAAMIALAAPSIANAQSATFTDAQRAEGESMVRDAAVQLASSLRDPSSATFRNVFIQKRINPKTGDHVALCGDVNARNGYGGFTGFQKFMFVAGSLYVGASGMFGADFLCEQQSGDRHSRLFARNASGVRKSRSGLIGFVS